MPFWHPVGCNILQQECGGWSTHKQGLQHMGDANMSNTPNRSLQLPAGALGRKYRGLLPASRLAFSKGAASALVWNVAVDIGRLS